MLTLTLELAVRCLFETDIQGSDNLLRYRRMPSLRAYLGVMASLLHVISVLFDYLVLFLRRISMESFCLHLPLLELQAISAQPWFTFTLFSLQNFMLLFPKVGYT